MINDTISFIISNNLSVSRFGDGEIDLLLKINQPKFQDYNKLLVEKLKNVLYSNNSNLLICLPKVFQQSDLNIFSNKAKKHWLKFIIKNRENIYNILDKNKVYGNALFTRNYMDLKDKSNSNLYFQHIKAIWNNRNIIIIEGRYTRFGVGNDLLENTNSIYRILCPEKNAFNSYDEILKTALSNAKKDTLFLIALGPTATILAADLSVNGYQAIDIGHLDIEYEWFLQGATTKQKVSNKYVNETDDIITPANDFLYNKKYESQIISIIN